MNFVTRFTTLATLLALGACGGGSQDDSPPPGGNTPPPPPPAVTAPAITTQPIDTSVAEGSTATFTVTATGESLAYQWRKNGTTIADASAASYTTPVLTVADDQAIYSVVVSNAGGSVTSGNARVTVTTITPPPPPPTGDGPLPPLTGPADPFPRAAAPLPATPVIRPVSPDKIRLLSWDPGSQGTYAFGFLHSSGAESRLSVPVNSFLDEVWMTQADVTDIGPQVIRVVAALHLTPGDLLTEKTLTVTFTIPDAMMGTLDPAQLIGFTADSDGSNLHMVPIVVGQLGPSVTRPGIMLDRLGIVGIAVASPEQQSALAAAWPADPADQINAALAPSLTAQWRAAVGVATSAAKQNPRIAHQAIAAAGVEGPATAALRGYYNDMVVPAFAAADADITLAPAAISAGANFLRLAALSGESGDGGTFQLVAEQVSARINSLFDRYADHVADQCRSLGGPPQLQLMMSTIRQLLLWGHAEKAAQLDEDLPRCSNFRMAFRMEYTRNAHWTASYTAGDRNGIDTFQEDGHAVIEGESRFGLQESAQDSQLRLTTLNWTKRRTRDQGGVSTDTWANENVTAPWRVNGLSVPLVRTRGGTPSSSVTLHLTPFIDIGASTATFHPFTATVTTHALNADGSEGSPILQPFTQVSLELFVPALPSDGQRNYGPMLVPPGRNASSQRTRTTPYHDGSIQETQTVTLTISRAE